MAPSPERFPRRCRLTRAEDIERVRAQGARTRTRWFDVWAVPSPHAYGRFAVVVPRFHGTAVARNNVKRRLREIVRRTLLPVVSERDVLLRALKPAYGARFADLRSAGEMIARGFGTQQP